MPRLEGYRFGRLVVKSRLANVIVLSERVVTNWRLADGYRLVVDDLQDVRDRLLEHLVSVPVLKGGGTPIRPWSIAAYGAAPPRVATGLVVI